MAKINDGELVARVRATGKGKKLRLNHVGMELGVDGRDARKFYEIRKQGVGRWTCSCMAYRFAKGEVGKKAPCKHMLKLFNDWSSGCTDGKEIVVLSPEAL